MNRLGASLLYVILLVLKKIDSRKNRYNISRQCQPCRAQTSTVQNAAAVLKTEAWQKATVNLE